MPSVFTGGTPPASRARLAAIDGGNDEKSGCVEGGVVDGDIVEGDIVEGDSVVGTSPTGSGGGSSAETTGLSLRGGIGTDDESWGCCGGSGSTGAGFADARTSASASGVTMLGLSPSSVSSGPGLGSDGLAKL